MLPAGRPPGCRRTTGGPARARPRRDVAGLRVGEEVPRVDRPGLVLQRETRRPAGVVDDAAGGAERVGAEVRREEAHDLRLPRSNEPCTTEPPTDARGGVGGGADDPSRCRCRGWPAGAPGTVHPSMTSPSSSKERAALAARHLDVVDEHAAPLHDLVAGVGDGHLDRHCRRESDRSTDHLLLAGRWAPVAAFQLPARTGRRARTVAVVGLVVREERVDGLPATERARVAGVVPGVVPVGVRQRGPVVGTDGGAPRRR